MQGYLPGRPAAIGGFRTITHTDLVLNVRDDRRVSQMKTGICSRWLVQDTIVKRAAVTLSARRAE